MSSVPPPGARPEPVAVVAERPPWPPWMAPAALFTALALAIFGGLVVSIVGAAFGASLQHPPPAVNLIATVLQDAAFIGAALFFASRAGPLVAAQFGLRGTSLPLALKWLAIGAASYLVLGTAWARLVDVTEKDQLPQDLGVHASTAGLVVACVIVTVIAPIAEELLFRGFGFAALRNWRGPWPAALLTGIVFGAIHAGSAPAVFLPVLAVLGVALCVVRWKTGSLLPCIAAHAANNAIAFATNEAHWNGWQTLLLIAGAVALALLATAPFLGMESRARPASRDARALI